MAAIKQQITEFSLKVANTHAHRRWHPTQCPSRRRKRAALNHREKQLDAVAVEIHFIYLSPKLKATDFFCQPY
jgi:hypothetical protein